MKTLLKHTGTKRRAFTLIELLIVIAIIAILALIALPNFLEAQMRAKLSATKANMRNIAVALEAYFVDYNAYPYRHHKIAGVQLSHNYRNYSTGCNNTLRLQAPIKYITKPGAMDDPFAQEPTDEPNLNYLNFLGASADKNLCGSGAWTSFTWTGTKDVTAPAPYRFGGDDARPNFMKWALLSRGPDRDFGDPRSNNAPGATATDGPHRCMENDARWDRCVIQGTTYFYDSTNGTMSQGNVWRSDGVND